MSGSTEIGESIDYGAHPSALLIAGDGEVALAGAEALSAAGMRQLGHVALRDAPARLAAQAAVDLILVEGSGASDEVLAPILNVANSLAHDGVAVVVAIDQQQIDLAASLLFGTAKVQLLCAPSVADRISAILMAQTSREPASLHDSGRDGEAARLQRLNEEVARIAETLARLTQGEGSPRREQVSDRVVPFRGPPSEAAMPAAPADVRRAIRARRMRDQFFGAGLFEDPAWDMLLDLFAADLEQARVSVSSLCIAAAVAPTTALRWIQRMTDAGLFLREADPFDRRRAFVTLSAGAREGMNAYWAAVARLSSPGF